MADTARRSIDKVTFSSIRPDEKDVRSGAVEKRRRGLDKIAFARGLGASSTEIAEALKREGLGADAHAGLHAIAAFVSADPRARTTWPALAATPASALAAAGRALGAARRERRGEMQTMVAALVADHRAHLRASAGACDQPASAAARLAPVDGGALTAAALRSDFRSAIEWVRVRDPGRLRPITETVHRLVGIDAARYPGLGEGDWDTLVDVVVTAGEDVEDWTDDLVDGFEERMKMEPIGRVHLERIDMQPVAIQRGELLHSVGLAPKETITIIHREWSSRETSFEKVVTEEFEQSTEEGVTENTELASATEVQARHASELSVDATASGSYGFASGSITVGYGSSSEDQSSRQESRNHALEVTRKASARTRKEHKTTFTVKETAGVEDQSVRTLTNASETEPMRIDFHQLMRKWQVDLFRRGVRLTFDIVVPSPGIDLLENIDELRRIEHELAQPFTFALTPAEITRANWLSLAARHGAQVTPPPAEVLLIQQSVFFENVDGDAANRQRFQTLEFDVLEEYRVRRGEFAAFFTMDDDGNFDVFDDSAAQVERNSEERIMSVYRSALEHLMGRTGRLAAVMQLYRVRNGFAQGTVEVALTAEGWRAWQHVAWASMRTSAEEQWNARRQELRQRRDQLGATIAAWDPLSLRRMEREEVMKTTLKWIFGPAFDLMPGEVGRLYGRDSGGVSRIEPSRLSPAQWAQVMGFGEFIKYLHQAIEWENVLYFVYPYFWDNPRNHKLKRFLNHPDSLHRAFLRGGAARVVLTIRPGFEESFTRLFETGTLDGELETDHPYVTIAQEIRAYAATTYPGIPGPAATPEEVEAAERGVHIGRWYEYTPVSATDITVNTPLDQLA